MNKRTRYFLLGSVAFLVIGLTAGLVAYYGGIPGVAFAQTPGPNELRYVPANAVVVAYANVGDLMRSDFRKQIRELEPADREKGQDEFRTATGINIETDIEYVVACMLPGLGADAGPSSKDGYIVARGTFDQNRIESLAREKGATEEAYGGKKLFLLHKAIEAAAAEAGAPPVAHQHGDMALAFLEPNVVAVGSSTGVRRAVDLTHGGASVFGGTNGKLESMVKGVDGGTAWAVGRFDVLSSQAHLPEQVSSQIPAITWFSATGHINGGVSGTVSVEAKDPEAAKNLLAVVNGFMALARMQTSRPEIGTLMNAVHVSSSEATNTVAVSFTLPSQAIDALKAAHRSQPGPGTK